MFTPQDPDLFRVLRQGRRCTQLSLDGPCCVCRVTEECTAHQVVSVRRSPECARMSFAQPSGPLASSTSRQQRSGMSPSGTAGGGGVTFEGGSPTAPGWLGPFTTCKIARARSKSAESFHVWVTCHGGRQRSLMQCIPGGAAPLRGNEGGEGRGAYQVSQVCQHFRGLDGISVVEVEELCISAPGTQRDQCSHWPMPTLLLTLSAALHPADRSMLKEAKSPCC